MKPILIFLDGATSDTKTMEWWSTQPDAWAACRLNVESPNDAMNRYLAWLKQLNGKLVFVGYPVSYDLYVCLLVFD